MNARLFPNEFSGEYHKQFEIMHSKWLEHLDATRLETPEGRYQVAKEYQAALLDLMLNLAKVGASGIPEQTAALVKAGAGVEGALVASELVIVGVSVKDGEFDLVVALDGSKSATVLESWLQDRDDAQALYTDITQLLIPEHMLPDVSACLQSRADEKKTAPLGFVTVLDKFISSPANTVVQLMEKHENTCGYQIVFRQYVLSQENEILKTAEDRKDPLLATQIPLFSVLRKKSGNNEVGMTSDAKSMLATMIATMLGKDLRLLL